MLFCTHNLKFACSVWKNFTWYCLFGLGGTTCILLKGTFGWDFFPPDCFFLAKDSNGIFPGRAISETFSPKHLSFEFAKRFAITQLILTGFLIHWELEWGELFFTLCSQSDQWFENVSTRHLCNFSVEAESYIYTAFFMPRNGYCRKVFQYEMFFQRAREGEDGVCWGQVP